MAKGITPHVSSTEEIVGFPIVSEFAGSVTMIPIVSQYGPVTPRIVNNRQLLKLYAGPSGIKRSDNVSLKTAFVLSKSTSLMVCRVCDTQYLPAILVYGNASGGKASILNVFYKDGKYYTATPKAGESNKYIITEKSTDEANLDFALIYNSPLLQNEVTFEIIDGKYENNVGEFRLTVPNGDSNKYTFSLDEDTVDGFGTSLYIENLNETQDYFRVVKFNNVPMTFDVGKTNKKSFGAVFDMQYDQLNSWNGKMVSDYTVTYVKEALNKLAKYRRDLEVKVVFDGGLTHHQIVSVIQTVAKKRKALGEWSTSIKCTSEADIRTLVSSNAFTELVNTNEKESSNLHNTCGIFSNTQWFGWREIFPESLRYILKIYSNISSNNEFAPIFGKINGLVTGAKPIIPFEHSTDPDELELEDNDENLPTTEWLQRKSVNPVIYDESINASYIVNNLTYQTPNLNQMSEENNRRFFNKIQFDLNNKLDNFIAKANNQTTRDQIGEMFDNYKSSYLDKLGYTVKSVNYDIEPYDPLKPYTISIKYQVMFGNSTKYIDVLYRNVTVETA